MIAAKATLQENLTKAMQLLKTLVIEELTAQGHKATGDTINSVRVEIEEQSGKFIGRLWIKDTARILDTGVTAARVPYRRGSGAGQSKYIDALIRWIQVIKPGLGESETKSFAFAIANKAKQEGHPTKGSFSYSQNGRRTEWVKFAITNNLPQFTKILDLGKFVAASFENIARDFNKQTIIA